MTTIVKRGSHIVKGDIKGNMELRPKLIREDADGTIIDPYDIDPISALDAQTETSRVANKPITKHLLDWEEVQKTIQNTLVELWKLREKQQGLIDAESYDPVLAQKGHEKREHLLEKRAWGKDGKYNGVPLSELIAALDFMKK